MYYLDILDHRVSKEQRIKTRREYDRNKYVFKCLHRQRYRCFYCGERIDERSCQLDHIMPVYRGGENNKGNLAATCKCCNNTKSADSIEILNQDTIDMYKRIRRGYNLWVEKKKKGLEITNHDHCMVKMYHAYHADRFRHIKHLTIKV